MADDLYNLESTLYYIERAQRLNAGLKTVKDFMLQDERFRDSLVLSVMTIAEYASKLSPEFQEKHPDIPWREMKGQRNIIAHNYEDVNYRNIWKSYKEAIPALKEQLISIMEKEYGLNYKEIKASFNLPKAKSRSVGRGR